MNATQNNSMRQALNQTSSAVTSLNNAHRAVNQSAMSIANNRPTAANNNAANAASHLNASNKRLNSAANTLEGLTKRNNSGLNNAAKNKIRTAAAYLRRASAATMQAKIAHSMVNVGKAMETLNGALIANMQSM